MAWMIEMMVQQKRIKMEGIRKKISEVASPQPDGIATAIKPKRGEKAKFDLGFNYEQKGKRKKWKHKRRGKRIKLEAGSVKRERQELPMISVCVEGAAFTRAHEEGKGRPQEVLLRHGENLANMVREVRRVALEAIFDGVYMPEDEAATASNRHLTLIQGLCTAKGAFNASLFKTTKGKTMLDNFAFGMMVRQFFRDASFAGEVVGQACREYSEMKKAAASPFVHSLPMMAAGNATVDGIYYSRTFPAGNREAELLVRHNLEEFIRGVFSAVKMAKESGRSSRYLEKYCYPPDGVLDIGKFENADKTPLKGEELFRSAISQFFCDSEMVKKAIGQALDKMG
jgi:hypothetical protein